MAPARPEWIRRAERLKTAGANQVVIADAMRKLEQSGRAWTARVPHKISRAYDLLRLGEPASSEVVAAALLPEPFKPADAKEGVLSAEHEAANKIYNAYQEGLKELGDHAGYKRRVSSRTISGVGTALEAEPRAAMLLVNDFKEHMEDEHDAAAREQMAVNALNFWAPLSERMNWNIATEIEDAAFEITNPRLFFKVFRAVEGVRNEEQAEFFAAHAEEVARAKNIPAAVHWRTKGIYRIFQAYVKKLDESRQQVKLCRGVGSIPVDFDPKDVPEGLQGTACGGKGKWQVLAGRLKISDELRKGTENLFDIAKAIDNALADAKRQSLGPGKLRCYKQAQAKRAQLLKLVDKICKHHERVSEKDTLNDMVSELKDCTGVRVVVLKGGDKSAYELNDAITARLKRIPGVQHLSQHDDDHLKTPKSTGYRALHSSFGGAIGGQPVCSEVQVVPAYAHAINLSSAPHHQLKDFAVPELGRTLRSRAIELFDNALSSFNKLALKRLKEQKSSHST